MDWFRQTRWDDDIAAQFDAKLDRARQKSQYLIIQAYMLLQSRPDIAAALCRRAIALADPMYVARAGLYLGTALALTGDTDGAIAALQGAIDAERQFPVHGTQADLDLALLIALAERSDLYDLALEKLAEESTLPSSERHPTALIAEALIRADRGQCVPSLVSDALACLEGDATEHDDLPPYISLRAIRSRLSNSLPRS